MMLLRRFCLLLACAAPATLPGQTPLGPWPQHALDRPAPPVVSGGRATTTPPPADAVVLLDGSSLAAWVAERDSAAARWRLVDGAMEVVPGTGGIRTRAGFGDVQLHIEWMAPNPPRGTGQDRGNSGVFFGGGRYEVQVLDSWQNATYPDGQAAALYGQFPPTVNASRPPGEWQSYDIVYRRPRFSPTGALLTPARLTVLHNGILVQDAMELVGPTANRSRPPYTAHPDRLPIALQDHGHPVRFRNIWVRPLEPVTP